MRSCEQSLAAYHAVVCFAIAVAVSNAQLFLSVPYGVRWVVLTLVVTSKQATTTLMILMLDDTVT